MMQRQSEILGQDRAKGDKQLVVQSGQGCKTGREADVEKG